MQHFSEFSLSKRLFSNDACGLIIHLKLMSFFFRTILHKVNLRHYINLVDAVQETVAACADYVLKGGKPCLK